MEVNETNNFRERWQEIREQSKLSNWRINKKGENETIEKALF